MHIRVLGGTEIEANGTSVTIGSLRQRRLLAALAMVAPETSTTDRLITAVWGADSPDNAVSALRTVVTRLRHSLDDLEPGTGQRIVSRPLGYVLDVPAAAVDANRFADLALAGRRRFAEGDIDASRRALTEALRTWRGPPYAEFADEPWAQGESARLERLWVAARTVDIEARLTSGLEAEILGDIHRLIDDEPISDGPRALLMRALFADGRQAEALRSLQDYRATLADETGLEPGPEVLQLEQRILANDPALLPPSGRALRGYRLHERLASTERGAIFRAVQPGLEREVAIEVIREEIAGDAAFVRSFELQGRALSRLNHAHLAPVYDCWREPGGAYLVRRLMSGGTLADAEVRERLGPAGLMRVKSQIRSALDLAHQAGLVHGAIDAGDIQLDDRDSAYLANFRLGATHTTVEDDDRCFERLFDALVGPTLPENGSGVPSRVGNPYRGLAAFGEHDVDVFFGRTRIVERALQTLNQHGTAFVVGPSGSGKSSLVRAGVLPALRAGELDGSDSWFIVEMVPGADPFAALEAAVLRVATHPPAELVQQLRDDNQPLATTIGRILPAEGGTAVLVIDQFEELFTATPEDQRDRFLAAIGAVMGDATEPLKVVATLRADFYDQPLARPAIAPVVSNTTVPCEALAGDELRAAIVGPAAIANIEIEPQLVGRLVADASGRPGTLPLLQFTLTQLFETRRENTLTLDAYLATGGLTAAVGERAEEVHRALDDAQQQTARRLFGRLVALDTANDTRRRARLSELRAAEDRPEHLDTVADRFVASRLLVTDRDPATREPTLEVAHESLFREWPRLAHWIREDRDTIATLRHLTDATASWTKSGDASELYRGARLAAALDLAEGHGDRLTQDEHAFVDAGQDAAEAEEQRQQRTNRRLRGLLITAGVLLVAALVAGLLANDQRRRADDRAAEAAEQATLAADQATLAESAAGEAQRAADAESAARNRADLERLTALARTSGAVPQEVAILTALEAHRIEPSPDTLEALHWALTSNPAFRGNIGDVRMGGDITVLDDGHRIVTHSLNTIEVWDVAQKTSVAWPFPGSEGVTGLRQLHSSALGDGTLLVASAPNVTTVLDAMTGATRASIAHPAPAAGPAVAVAVSPDGSRFALALSGLGAVEVYEADNPTVPIATKPLSEAAPTLTWHPDSRQLAIGTTDGDVRLWDTVRGLDAWVFDGTLTNNFSADGSAPAVLFSSDGARLVVAGLTAGENVATTSVVLELATDDRRELSTRTANIGAVRSLSWLDANEATVLISGLGTDHVQFVGITTPAMTSVLQVNNFEASASLPELGLIVTEASIGLDIHSVEGSNGLVRVLPNPTDLSLAGRVVMTLNANGSQLLTSGLNDRTYSINPTTLGSTWEPFVDPTGAEFAFALGGGDGVITVRAEGWVRRNWEGEQLSDPLPLSETGGAEFVGSSPTGNRLFVGSPQTDALFELGSPSQEIADLGKVDLPFVCCSLPAFSSDGALLSRPDRRGGTDLFDAESGIALAFEHDIEAQLFGPRGTWFAAVDDRGTIHLHDQQTGERIGSPMVGNRGPITFLRPSLDGRRIAAVGSAGTTRIWDLDTMTQIGRPIDITWPTTPSFSADGRTFAAYVVGEDGIGRIEVWNLDTETWPTLGCELAGRNMTEDEWAEYGPRTIERRRTCPDFDL